MVWKTDFLTYICAGAHFSTIFVAIFATEISPTIASDATWRNLEYIRAKLCIYGISYQKAVYDHTPAVLLSLIILQLLQRPSQSVLPVTPEMTSDEAYQKGTRIPN